MKTNFNFYKSLFLVLFCCLDALAHNPAITTLLALPKNVQLFNDNIDSDNGWVLAEENPRTAPDFDSRLLVADGVMALSWIPVDLQNQNLRGTTVSATLPISSSVNVNDIEWMFKLRAASSSVNNSSFGLIGPLHYALHYGDIAISIDHQGAFEGGLGLQTPATIYVRYNATAERLIMNVNGRYVAVNPEPLLFGNGILASVNNDYAGPSYFRVTAGSEYDHLPVTNQGLVEVDSINIQTSDGISF